MTRLQFAINNIQIDQIIRVMSAVDQDKYESKIPLLDCDDPEFYWVYRNMDFEHWELASSGELWLSGPPQRNLHQVASHVLRQAKKNASNSLRYVLYFFSSTAASEKSSTTIVFVSAILHQIIRCLSLPQRHSVIAVFLRTLLDTVLGKDDIRQERIWKPEELSPGQVIKELLNIASHSEHLEALKAVLGLEQLEIRELYLVVAELGEHSEIQKGEFIEDLRRLFLHLQQSPWKVKVLLTSYPQEEFQVSLEGRPSIEYDRERNGFTILPCLPCIKLSINAECLNILRFNNTRYDKISKEHEGSFKWLWTHEKYLNWSSSNQSRLLYIQGKPGSGKSTLTKYFKDNLMKRELNAHPATAILASFFYSFREGESQKSHYNMLRLILYDILNQDESYFYHFQKEHREYRKLEQQRYNDLPAWHYEALKRVLLSIGDHPRVGRLYLYLVVDAVDESSDKDRCNILRLLFQLCAKARCIIKVFVASRPVVELDHQMARFQKSGVIRMQDMNVSDIRSFVDSFLPEMDLPSHIHEQATEYIVAHAQGVFLWVRLVREKLIKYATKGYNNVRIFNFLKSLPRELEGLYELILQDLCRPNDEEDDEEDDDDIADGFRMFQYVLFTRRPLRISGLQHYLAILGCPDAGCVPSIDAFEGHIILKIKNRITHCGRNLIDCKEGISSP